ncbi:hypothetical protein EES39_30980 [Streptomyces sp. ADI92-24]|nr:hypothetical protein EES39_30980 [Streptomyces sp. ADI92-24]
MATARVQVRRIADYEGQKLQQIVRRGNTNSARYRRAMILPASAGDNTVPVIAHLVAADEDTVREGQPPALELLANPGLGEADPVQLEDQPAYLPPRPQLTGKPQAGWGVIEDSLPYGGLLGLGQNLMFTPRRPRGRDSSASRPPACHLAHQLSTTLTDTLNRSATSTRSRPSASADTASNRTASCASGDQVRASPPPDHSHAINEPERKAFRINKAPR